MKKKIADKWVEALRSGEYKQCKGYLKSKNGGHCCLGVLTELYNKENNKIDKGYRNKNSILSNNVKEWAALRTIVGGLNMGGIHLAGLNDIGEHQTRTERLNFDEIADIIQINYKEL